MLAPNTKERATLEVGGSLLEDWESVWVQKTWGDAYHQFRFVYAERQGEPGSEFNAIRQIKPGDSCTVKLAGQLAITGEVLTRQVAYDAYSHGVTIQGVSRTWKPATSSIIHETHSYDGKSFLRIAREVLQPTDQPDFETQGTVDERPFKNVHSQPGEEIFPFLARIGQTRDIQIAATKEGRLIFIFPNAETGNQGQLIEGQNILRCQCVISIQQSRSKYKTIGSVNADGQVKWRKASEKEAEAPGDEEFKGWRPLVTPIEAPVDSDEELKKHAYNTSRWAEGTKVQATIVTTGWQPGGPGGGGELWEPGREVTVDSPMAMLTEPVRIQSVTFTQDNNSGSLSTLVCVAPWALQGRSKFKSKSVPPRPAQMVS